LDSHLDIAIVGSGSAGPAAAALLTRQGHTVTLFEKAPRMLPIGAGFVLQPSGMDVVKKLGCYDRVMKETQRIDSLFCKTTKNKVLLDLFYKDVQEDLFGCGTQRAAFLEILLKQCKLDGVSIKWGHEITSIKKWKGKRIVASNNESYGAFDLRTTEFAPNQLWQVVEETDILNGFLPTGTSEDLLSLFYSVEMSEINQVRAQSLQQWKGSILRTAPKAESFLQQIQSFEQLQVAKYSDVILSRWHDDQVAVLGDAAHALSPQLGQGVNLALQDAEALADVIDQNATLPEALSAYSKVRRRQVHFYQFATRMLTPFFQSNYPPLGVLRDFGFPIATKSKWIRDQMTLSMAGYKTGIFTSKPF